jgi:HEAT repeat protein
MLAAAERMPAEAEARVDLLVAAARLGDKKAAPGLQIALTKSSERGRVIAAGALGLLRSRAAVPALIVALKDSSRLRLQAAAAHALGLIGDDQAIEPLIALAALAKVYAPARIRSLDALATFRARAAIPLATQLVDHPERDIGKAVLRLLTRVPTRFAEPVVAFALKTPLLRGQAARAAVAMEASALGPQVLEAAVDAGLTGEERTWLLHALGVFPPTGTATRLMDRYKLAEKEERIALLKAMPDVGDRTIAPRLVEALSEADGEVANYAVYALENLTGKRYGADLQAWRKFVGEAAPKAPSALNPMTPHRPSGDRHAPVP